MDLREVGCDSGEWIGLAEDRDQWRAYVRAVMKLNIGQVQKGRISMYFSQKRHVVAPLRRNQPP